jgi:circadian clock protein KaiC
MVSNASNGRAKTGVPGLDTVLGGGLPRDRIYLVQGDPGVGKTTLALQFLMTGAAAGETSLYLTLSETTEELRAVAKSHGWSLDGLSLFELPLPEGLGGDAENTLFHPSEVELAETTRILLAEVQRINPSRVVFDSLSEIRLLSQGALRYRRQILALKQFFVGRGCTTLLLDDRTSEPGDLQLQSLAHGVLSLEQLSPLYGADRRRMRVVKLRGVAFSGGFHDFALATGGIHLFPRLVAAEERSVSERVAILSGVPKLDQLAGGGLDGGTSTLLMGPAGTGKSTVAIQYVLSTAESGERALIFAFDESVETLMKRAAGLGMNLARHVEAGNVEIRRVDPAELTPGEFTHSVREAVEERQAKLIVIDSLNGYLHAMPEERFLTLQLHELLTYLGQLGVVTLLVVAQHGLVGAEMASPIDVSYLADTVFVFRHFEVEGRLRKSVSMLKRRSGRHETTIRELSITPSGIEVGEPLDQFIGVMSGTASRAPLHQSPE